MRLKNNKNDIIIDMMTYIIHELQQKSAVRHVLKAAKEGDHETCYRNEVPDQENNVVHLRLQKTKDRMYKKLEIARFHSNRLQNLQTLLYEVAASTLNLHEDIVQKIRTKEIDTSMLNKINDQYTRGLLSMYLKEQALFITFCTKHNIERFNIYVLT